MAHAGGTAPRARRVLPALPLRGFPAGGYRRLSPVPGSADRRPPRDPVFTTSFVDEFDLFNGFADIVLPLGDQASVTLRGGRQELMFGSQRLVGPGDFTQVPRTFEGGMGIIRVADWTVSSFWVEPGGRQVPVQHVHVGSEVLRRLRHRSPSPLAREPGPLLARRREQGGHHQCHRRAGAATHVRRADVGQDRPDRAGLRGRGGGPGGDGRPRRRRRVDVHTRTSVTRCPSRGCHPASTPSSTTRAGTASAAALRPGTGTTARYVGAEIDLLATYNFTRHLLGYAGYSRFFAGEFIRRTGLSRDSDFLYGALQYTF
jgi:hypothetical protein